MSYNSHRPQNHPFEVVKTSKYHEKDAIVKCPVCGITRWSSAMRIHIAKMAKRDEAHKDYYEDNTYEETIVRRVWKV